MSEIKEHGNIRRVRKVVQPVVQPHRVREPVTVHARLFQFVLDTLVALWTIALVMVLHADWPTTGKLVEVVPLDRNGVIHELAYVWLAAFGTVYSLIYLKRKWSDASVKS